jgi:hypothetical protein
VPLVLAQDPAGFGMSALQAGPAVGLGFANGPASSASTASVAPEEVGQASGISNMARYLGGSLAVAAMAIMSAAGVGLALLMARHRPGRPRAIDRAAAAAVTTHTIPIEPATGS